MQRHAFHLKMSTVLYVIRYFYLKGKTGKEMPMFMGLLHHLMLRLNSGMGNSNAVDRL